MDTIGSSPADFIRGGISMTFDLERARGLRDFLQDDCAEVGDVWAEMIAEIERLRAENAWLKSDREFQSEEQAARISDLEIEITGLKADLEQSEEIKRLKDELENYGDHYACLLISKDAQIKELEGMLSIRTEELDIAHSVARSEKEMHEKELAAFARRIKELEDALVEGLTNFLHYRASCYDPARRCPYAKECDDCSTWDACGHVEKFRSEARRRLQAEGKIGSGGGA
jgi:chromosome segregation ATPase